MNQKGTDFLGNNYQNIEEMWQKEFGDTNNSIFNQVGSVQNWYAKARQYWENCEASNKGVLGGLDFLHALDIRDSKLLLDNLKKKYSLQTSYAIDCGAGIGRITKDFLS